MTDPIHTLDLDPERLLHATSENIAALLLIMRGRVRAVLRVHELLGCSPSLIGIIELRVMIRSEQISDGVTVTLIAGPTVSDDTVYTRVQLLASKEAKSIADVDDTFFLARLDPLPFTRLGCHDLKPPLVAEEDSQGTQVCVFLMGELSWVTEESENGVRWTVVEVILHKVRVSLESQHFRQARKKNVNHVLAGSDVVRHQLPSFLETGRKYLVDIL